MTSSNDPASAVGTEFSGDEYDEAYPPGYELHYWHRARGAIVRDCVRATCKAGDTVLEIGAGRGHYVGVLRAAGFDAYGCDLGSPRVHEDVRPFVSSGTDFADSLRFRHDRNCGRTTMSIIVISFAMIFENCARWRGRLVYR